MWGVVWRSLVVSSLLGGCVIDNPGFDEPIDPSQGSGSSTLTGTSGTQTTSTSASESEGVGGSLSATGTTTSTGSTSAVTGNTGTSTTGTSTGEGTTSTGDATSSTGSPDFEPFSVQNYVKESCKYYAGCFSPQSQPYPTKLHAMECFSTELEPPFVIESVSALVDFRLGNVPIKVALHSAEAPGSSALTAVDLPAYSGSGGIHEFVLPEPLVVESPDFCVRLTTGNVNTALAVGFDHKTGGTPDSYVQQQVDCKAPFGPLDVHMEADQATWCMSAKLAPP